MDLRSMRRGGRSTPPIYRPRLFGCAATTPTTATRSAFGRVAEEAGGLDVLVNSAWGGYERMVENGAFTWGAPFWQQPAHRWTSMMDAGVRAAFSASAQAAPLMVAQSKGLIVNISFWAAQKYVGNSKYGISKAATDKMTADMAHELRRHGVAVVSLYPGLVRTELVLEAARGGWLDVSKSESPEFIGRVVAAQVGVELGVVDTDGTQPVALGLDSV